MKIIYYKTNQHINKNKIDRIVRYTKIIFGFKCWQFVHNISLVRSMVLFYFLRRAGLNVSINFGIKKEYDIIRGHCWLTLDDNLYLEKEKLCKEFKQIYRFPEKKQKKY